MKYTITTNEISNIIFILKHIFINVGAYYIFLKLSGKNKNFINTIKAIICIGLVTCGYAVLNEKINPLDAMSLFIIFLMLVFINLLDCSTGYTIIITLFSISISYSIFFIATVINSFPSIILNILNDNIIFVSISIIYLCILIAFLRIKKLKNGISFFRENAKNELFDIVILNISVIILFSIEVFGNYNILMQEKMGTCIIILSIIMFLTIKKSFQVYYKQKLMIKQLEETTEELKEKEEEIKKLEQENLSFSKRSHSLAHKQKALEYKLNQLLMNEETANELGIQKEVKDLSKELYQKPVEELTKTGIRQIDDMLEFMQAECTKNNIDFNFQIMGNVYYIINNIISVEKLEILLADHIKDAIIAIKHTDNINRSILVRLGKIEECYGLYIYDSGIEFEKETLQNLGKKPSTTHEDEGGTGMGFMNTFDTLRECKGSLIINEISKPSKDNFTKVIMIKFDNKNEFNVISYKN